MASLFYPQLNSGAVAQYPIRKVPRLRTVRNVMPDGSLILFPDSGYSTLEWQLDYQGLSFSDVQLLKAHFDACSGPLTNFTFLDPAGNLLSWSSDITNQVWTTSPLLQVQAGIQDMDGNMLGFRITNSGQAYQEISQNLMIPANYSYCLSLSATSAEASVINLFRRGPSSNIVDPRAVTPAWSEVSSSGAINDSGVGLTVGISLAPGQQITIAAVQLQAQLSPSPYLATAKRSGVYTSAFWLNETFEASAEAPDVFSTVVSIESSNL